MTGSGPDRARAADLGLAPRALPAGPLNAITDVPGIRVGHTTVIQAAGDTHGEIRTGVTAIVHDALIGRGSGGRTLPAGLAVFNGFGKMPPGANTSGPGHAACCGTLARKHSDRRARHRRDSGAADRHLVGVPRRRRAAELPA